MDMSGNNKLELEKRIDHSYNNQAHSLCSNWRYVDANTTNPSLGLSSNENPIVVCSSASMMDSFGPSVWELSANSQPSGFNEINVQNAEASWDSSSSMIKNGVFLPNLSHSLSEYPADCAFIERASHFSSFSGANLGHMVSPIGIHHPQNNVMHMVGHYEEVPLPVERGNVEASTSKDERKGEKSYNESEEAVFSGSGGRCQEDGEPCFTKGLGLKKRKKGVQDMKPKKASNGIQLQTGESAKDTTGVQQKEDQNPTSTPNTTPEKHDKQASQASDPPKEYIHVRARRGQATNSHSLAERVRREKISERMKLLQELVPGCSKVTGKAVMLDEIINYVQSLQRQVEFLSMKLATVNPRLDLNIKQLLAKEHLFSAQAGSSSSLGFSPAMSMACPSVQPPQSFFVPPGIGNSSDMLRRIVDSGLTTMSSGSIPQLQNAWEDELHNVVQMGLDSGIPSSDQYTDYRTLISILDLGM